MAEARPEFYRRTAELYDQVRKTNPELFIRPGNQMEPSDRMKRLLALADETKKLHEIFENDESEKRLQELLDKLRAMEQQTNAVSENFGALMKNLKLGAKKEASQNPDELSVHVGEHQLVVYAEHCEVVCEKHCEFLRKKYEGKLSKEQGGSLIISGDSQDVVLSRHSVYPRDHFLKNATDLQSSNKITHKQSSQSFMFPGHANAVRTIGSGEAGMNPLTTELKSIAVQTDNLILCDSCRIPILTAAMQLEMQNLTYKNVVNNKDASATLTERSYVQQQQQIEPKLSAKSENPAVLQYVAHDSSFLDKNVRGAAEQGYPGYLRRNSLGSETPPAVPTQKLASDLDTSAKMPYSEPHESHQFAASRAISKLRASHEVKNKIFNDESPYYPPIHEAKSPKSVFTGNKTSDTRNSELFAEPGVPNQKESFATHNLDKRFGSPSHKGGYDSTVAHVEDDKFLEEGTARHSNTDGWVPHVTSDKGKLTAEEFPVEDSEGSASEKLALSKSLQMENIYEKHHRCGSRGSANQEFSFLEGDSKVSSGSGHGHKLRVSRKLQKSVQDTAVETLSKSKRNWKEEDSVSLASDEYRRNVLLNSPEKRYNREGLRKDTVTRLNTSPYQSPTKKQHTSVQPNQTYGSPDKRLSAAVPLSQQCAARYTNYLEGDRSSRSQKEATVRHSSHYGNEREIKSASHSVSGSSETDIDDNDPGIPLTATNAFQKLIGNIPMASKTKADRLSEYESDSDDDVEKALSASLNARAVQSAPPAGKQEQAPVEQKYPSLSDRKRSTFSVTDSPSKRLSGNPSSRIAGKLSDATLKALGLSPELARKTQRPSAKDIKEGEDSDEFDFYD